MKPRRLASFIAAGYFALALLPLAATGAVAFVALSAELRRSAERAFAEAAVLVSAQVSNLLTTPSRLVSVAARGVAAASGPGEAWARDLLLGGLKEGYPAFARLELYGGDGRLSHRYPADPDRLGDSATGRDFYRAAAEGGDAWSSVFIDADAGVPMVAVASKGPAGVLAGFVDLSALDPLVSELAGLGGAYAAVLDSTGIYIAHPDRERVSRRESARLIEAVAEARPGRISVSVLREGGREILCAAAKEPKSGWTIALFRDRAEVYAPVRVLLAVWGAVVAAAAAAAALLALAMARNVAKPFRELELYASRLGEGPTPASGTAAAPAPRFSELARVADALADSAAKVAQRESELRDALASRDALAREIQHRVKNNLAVLVGLLNLAREDASEDARGLLEDLRGRIFAMSAVHELSYSNGSLSEIHAGQYLSLVLESAVGRGGRLSSRLDCEDLVLPVDTAVPLGLAANELATNAVKHAYPGDGPAGELRMSLSRSGPNLRLVVSDDGVGLPAAPDGGKRRGTGLELVGMLAAQLGGRLELGTSAGGGLEATIAFPAERK